MNSLIDLTFILLVVFIVTLPTLEQSIHVLLPVGKTQKAQNDKKKVFSITVDSIGKLFVGDAPRSASSSSAMRRSRWKTSRVCSRRRWPTTRS